VWVERAKLDIRLEAPPEEPLTYLDVVVPTPTAETYRAGAAREDGFAARRAAQAKHTRYPDAAGVPGRLVPLAVEAYGRWGEEGLAFLRAAAGRACLRCSALGALAEQGPPALLGAWLQKASVGLQKANAALLRSAAGSAASWVDPQTGLDTCALDILAMAEHLAAAAAE